MLVSSKVCIRHTILVYRTRDIWQQIFLLKYSPFSSTNLVPPPRVEAGKSLPYPRSTTSPLRLYMPLFPTLAGQPPASSQALFQSGCPEMLSNIKPLPQCRPWPASHRMVHVGDLSERSGAIDFLITASVWAENHPEQLLEIWWLGDGDFISALADQPLPKTVSQAFLGPLDQSDRAQVFAECGLLVVPSRGLKERSIVREALASGLLVLGNRRNATVRKLVGDAVDGWLFDPVKHNSMLAALSNAMTQTVDGLNGMRSSRGAFAQTMNSGGIATRMRQAIAILLSNDDTGATEPAPGGGQAL
jgi:hypothetical protein